DCIMVPIRSQRTSSSSVGALSTAETARSIPSSASSDCAGEPFADGFASASRAAMSMIWPTASSKEEREWYQHSTRRILFASPIERAVTSQRLQGPLAGGIGGLLPLDFRHACVAPCCSLFQDWPNGPAA